MDIKAARALSRRARLRPARRSSRATSVTSAVRRRITRSASSKHPV